MFIAALFMSILNIHDRVMITQVWYILVTIVFIYNSNHIRIDLSPHLTYWQKVYCHTLGIPLLPITHVPHHPTAIRAYPIRKRSGPAFLSQAGKRSGACLHLTPLKHILPTSQIYCEKCFISTLLAHATVKSAQVYPNLSCWAP